MNEKFGLGPWAIDPEGLTITNGDQTHRLESKAMAVLVHLREQHPHVVSREELLDAVWSETVVVDNVVHRAVTNLRKALGDDARHPRFIETVPTRGYRLLETQTSTASPNPQELITDKETDHAPEETTRRLNIRWQSLAAISILILSAVFILTPDPKPPEPIETSRSDPRIAVMPLANLSGDPDNDYLGFAMAEEIQAQLRQTGTLQIIATTSSRAAALSTLSAAEIGQHLDAEYLLEGSVSRTGNRLRVKVRLIDTGDSSVIWDVPYDRTLTNTADLFSLYDAVSESIARSLLPTFDPESISTAPPTRNMAAYELVAHAGYVINTTGDPLQAHPLADRAIELDPDYAKAYALKAALCWVEAEFGFAPAKQKMLDAREWVEKARVLDPDLILAHTVSGSLHQELDLDFSRAMASFVRARQLGAPAEQLAVFEQDLLWVAGHFEEGLKRTLQWELEEPTSGQARVYSGRLLHRLGRQAEAYAKFDEALALAPDNASIITGNVVYEYLFVAQDIPRAQAVMAQHQMLPSVRNGAEAEIARLNGDPKPLEDYLSAAVAGSENRYVRPRWISNHFYRLGDYAEHIRWFELSVQELDSLSGMLDFLHIHPDYQSNLQAWSLADPEQATIREALLSDHFERLDRVTAKMVLPE